jgi:hypothetical protein
MSTSLARRTPRCSCSTAVTFELTEQERGFLFGVCYHQYRRARLAVALIDADANPTEADIATRDYALLEVILRKLSYAR